MKSMKLLLVASALAGSSAFFGHARGADVTVYDSIVSLATNATKNYTFTDPASGQNVVIAVTMSPYAPGGGATIQALDGDTRVGANGQNGFIDGSGADFSATLVSASGGVTTGSIQFRIAALAVRPVDGGGALDWTSSATTTNFTYNSSAEIIQPLDTTNAPLSYASALRFPGNALFQLTDVPAPGQSIVLNATFTVANAGDPQLTSWITSTAGRYARIYTTDANKTNGVTATTWTNSTQPNLAQTFPAYAGVQEVDFSTNWIYVRSTDFANYIMGPWYNDATRTTTFLNSPTNQHVLYVLPRTATLTNPPATKTPTYGPVDAIGYFVNGVAMFDALDGFVWNGSSEIMGGNFQWRRGAYPNESPTFDPGYSHQQNTGEYHNHADPIALRYTLGDHVDFNPVSKIYTESTNAPAKHSPILGWVRDGYPIYGPFGYSNPSNAASGIRRMISGYQLRNGQNGSDNLTNVGRANLPAWMLRNNGNTTQSGPPVNATYPAGRYLQDYAYLGDLTNSLTSARYQFGVDFDLNEYDCRWCVTPEFPAGTYAYFITIDANGVPIAPWNVGMYFFGNPTGFKGSNISETITTNFLGAPNLHPVLNPPAANNGTVTLTWSATEGGTYRVESTTNFSSWTAHSTNVAAVLNAASFTNSSSDSFRFYRVVQTALAKYDPAASGSSGGGGGSNSFAPGGSASRSTTVTVTITLPSTPPNPPANAPITSVTLAGTITGTSVSDATSGTVIATFAIPANSPTGAQNIVVTFQSPGPTYTLTGGFTIN